PLDLLIKDAHGRQPPVLLAHIMTDLLPDNLQYAWSPDSRWLFYRWKLDSGAQYVGISTADGHHQFTIYLSDKDVFLQGWLNYSQNIVVVSGYGQSQHGIIFDTALNAV